MLYLPQNIPAFHLLQQVGKSVDTYELSSWKNIECEARILLLNLMPQKAVTELDLSNMMVASGLRVQLIPVKFSGQTYKTTPMQHMEDFYLDIEQLWTDFFDGLIITGAPVEQIPFEEVRYWGKLCKVMDWSRTHTNGVLFICWAAQAALYHRYQIPKYMLPEKKFGIYPQNVHNRQLPIFNNMPASFPMPTSRHTEVRAEDFADKTALEIVASSEDSGVGVVFDDINHSIYVVGHLEYEPLTLHKEYKRDVEKGLPISIPVNYYSNPQLDEVDYSWETVSIQFYRNWLYMCLSTRG